MTITVQGIYRDGKIELAEIPSELKGETPVVVTFLTDALDLRAYGIDEAHAAELRTRLATFAEDWDSPDMDIYNDYDANKAKL